MASMLTLSAVDRRFEPRSGQIKVYEMFVFAAVLLSLQYVYP